MSQACYFYAETFNLNHHSFAVKKLANAIPGLDKPHDHMKETDFIKSEFSLDIGKREELNKKKIKFSPREIYELNCFTDGSKTQTGTGAAYVIKGKSVKEKYSEFLGLSNNNSVFQAEVYAIGKASERILNENIVGRDITFHVDSQAALRAVNKYQVKSKLTRYTKNLLNRVAINNNVKLSWIPAHEKHFGNEIADKLAKRGTRLPDKIELPLSKSYFTEKIESWGKKVHQKRWDNLDECRQTKMFCPKIDNNIMKLIRKMDRRKSMYATQILTGHACLQYHLNKMKIVDSPTCLRCGENDETVEHFVAKCPAYAKVRKSIFNEFFLEKELHEYKVEKVLKFVSKTKRLIPEMN